MLLWFCSYPISCLPPAVASQHLLNLRLISTQLPLLPFLNIFLPIRTNPLLLPRDLFLLHPIPQNEHLSWAEKEQINQERFRDFVVGAHMLTTFIELLLNGVWYWYSAKLDSHQVGAMYYIVVATSTVVFVVELRIRKNEVARALRSLVGSVKKSYIRWVGGEK